MSLMYIILIAAVIAIIIYFFFFRNKKDEEFRRNSDSARGENKRSFNIENVGIGGSFSISNFGPDSKFFNVTVNQKTRRHEGKNFWYELEGETSTGDAFWLQIESVDPYELNGGIEELDFDDLGVSTTDMEIMRKGNQGFVLDNEPFFFEGEGEAQCYVNDAEDGDFQWYRYWEFSNEGANAFITVEQFEENHPEASISHPIATHQLKIFELGEDVGD